MKILLIDNHTDYLYNVTNALTGHDVETQRYEPGLDFHWQDKDLIILSGGGGEGYELKDTTAHGRLWYEDEMEFVAACPKPLLGICMGFEVISAAYGSKVKELPGLLKGFKHSKTTLSGQTALSKEHLKQFQYHRFYVDNIAPAEFDVLADSGTGIELIKHKKRKVIASQFHPEIPGGTLELKTLLNVVA